MPVDRRSAERLLDKLKNAPVWPPKKEEAILKDLFIYSYFREADGDQLKKHHRDWPDDKPYTVDPLASRIAEAFADLVFGEEPDFVAGNSSDQARLEDLVFENSLPAELQTGDEICTSEGEVWWRIKVDKDELDWPIIEFHSRINVYPFYIGRKLAAVAFINIIEDGDNAWRYVEIHAEGIVLNRLFKVPQKGIRQPSDIGAIIPPTIHGGKAFGEEVPLTDRLETESLPYEWEHDLPVILAGRVMNRRGRDFRVGVSQYKRVKDFLFNLNEAASIGHRNLKLTARKRAVVDESVIQPQVDPRTGQALTDRPVFDTHEEVLVASSLDENLESKTGPFKILEYDFDARALIDWYDHLVDTILTRTRTAPQLVGRHTEQALSAPALRARLIDSTLAANAKGRFWDNAVPHAIRCAQLVDQLRTVEGGFDRRWNDAEERPRMIRKSIIPEDVKDKTERHALAMGAELESRYTALQDMHPEWSDEQIEAEIERIREDGDIGIPNGRINRPITRRNGNGPEPRLEDDPSRPRIGESS